MNSGFRLVWAKTGLGQGSNPRQLIKAGNLTHQALEDVRRVSRGVATIAEGGVGFTVADIRRPSGNGRSLRVVVGTDRKAIKSPTDHCVSTRMVHLFDHAVRFDVVVIVVSTPGMAATLVKLVGLIYVVPGLMVGEDRLRPLSASGVVLDGHAVHGDAKGCIACERGGAQRRFKNDASGEVCSNRHRFFGIHPAVIISWFGEVSEVIVACVSVHLMVTLSSKPAWATEAVIALQWSSCARTAADSATMVSVTEVKIQ